MAELENHFSFTIDRLARVTCPPSGRPQRDGRAWFWDTKVVGLAFSVTETGSRSFVWYRRVGKKIRKVKLGPADEMTVEQARRRAAELNDDLHAGRDPVAEKQAKERAEQERVLKESTVAELWTSYLENHLVDEAKPSTVADYTRLYTQHLAKGESPWSKRLVTDIAFADVEKLKMKIGASSGRTTANRVIQMIGAMYRSRGHLFGLPHGFSPTTGVDLYTEKPRDRVLSTDELGKVMAAIDAEDNLVARDYFKMLLYTGARRNTVARMAWEDLDIGGRKWKIPGEKMKNGDALVLALIPEALAILKRRLDDNPPGTPFVFASKNFTPEQVVMVRTMRSEGATTRAIGDKMNLSQTAVMHILSPKFKQRGVTAFGGAAKAWRRIIERAKLAKKTTIHDIRRTFCTGMIERGVSLHLVAAAMGHRSMETTQRHYAFASDKAVANAVRESMAGLLADVAESQRTNAAEKSA